MRRILAFVMSTFVVTLLWVIFSGSSMQVHAATDASWIDGGKDISYNGQTYVPTKASSSTDPNLKNGTTFYQHLNLDSNEAFTIAFPNGTATGASSADFAEYKYSGNGYGSKITSSTISITPLATASPAGTATWSNGNIVYDGTTYIGSGTAGLTSTGSNPSVPSGDQYYQHINLDTNKASVIYFASSTSPTSAKTATYQTFSISDAGNGNYNYTNPSAKKSISITPINGSTSTGASTTTDPSASSCAVSGIGWIVCPVSTFLASGMDHIYTLIEGYLVVQPLSTATSGPSGTLFNAWNYIRSIANVAFVIAFLIIIYSQITNMGISNYSVKKLLPRLIIAAILVNLSYFICTIAIDISNIVGASLEQVFIDIRNATNGANSTTAPDWQSMTGFILAGGTATAAGVVGLSAAVVGAGASAGAAVILIVPMLVGLLLAVLVALIILAARQALIVILVIASPLAFVAYLLPNTEKWFTRWRKWLMDMLIFFPLFSVVFGGSQLAGFIIIHTANGANALNETLLGMFVQVAPLVLTPLLVRFSGEIVGKVAGLVNNPKKGIMDRTRSWAQDRSQLMAAKNMARTDPVQRRQIFRRYALGSDQQRRIREDSKAMYGATSDARWANSDDYRTINQGQQLAQEQKSLGESRSQAMYAQSKNVVGVAQNLDLEVRNAKLDLENANAQATLNWESNHDPRIQERRIQEKAVADSLSAVHSTHEAEFEEFRAGQAGTLPANSNVARMLRQSQEDTRMIALNGFRNTMAKQVQQERRTTEMLANSNTLLPNGQRLQTYAGGIHASGAERALALALSEQHKARAESIANANAIIEHLNLNAAETLDIAKNISVKGVVVSSELQEAAVKRVASNGHMPSIFNLLESDVDFSRRGNENMRLTLVEALRGNNMRPKFIGAGVLDQLTQGIANGINRDTLDTWIQNMILDGKLSAQELAQQDKDTLVRVSEGISRIPRSPQFTVALRNLDSEIGNLQANDQLWDRAGERKAPIQSIHNEINK